MATMALVRKVAARIKKLREERDMTQEDLAVKAGVSRGYLARVETGRHEPTLSTLEKLAKALKVKVGKLLE
jgi:transcriptional regulator with XRE-family HTH domain